jgi:anti-sigma factor RsiW
MNDLHHPCDNWTEAISLASADCLSPDEKREVRHHLETCLACRERFRQLTELCGAFAETKLPSGDGETAIIERVMSAVASDATRKPMDRMKTDLIQSTVLSRTHDHWSWIMRSPIHRVSVAAVFVLAVTGIALLFHGGGATVAFADFIAPILEAKNARFKVVTEVKGPPVMKVTGQVMALGAARSRQQMQLSIPGTSETQEMVMIFDWVRRKSLTLVPKAKTAVVASLENLTEEQIAKQDMFASFRSILLDARNKEGINREALGEREIDGRRVVGFRVHGKGMVVDLWGDPTTGLPVSAEVTMALTGDTKTTMSDFTFNLQMDESLFSVDPPVGYTVQNINVDVSPPEEQDLITALREYQAFSGGVFPDSIELQKMMEGVGRQLGAKIAEKPDEGNEKLSEEQLRDNLQVEMQKLTAVQMRLQRGILFALATLPPEADAHYAGKGVSFGQADAPIFWYRLKDSPTYRVINADLSARDSETPPDVPNAQRLSVSPNQVD